MLMPLVMTSLSVNSECWCTLYGVQVIKFKDRQTALSFVSLLDGYYRLQENYHHHLCQDVESPMIDQLRLLRCHGPVR